MSADLQTIARFSSLIDAELARNHLVDEGLNAVVAGDLTTNMFGLGYATGGIELLVPAGELERARAALADLAREMEANQNRPPEAITAHPPAPQLQEEPPTPEELAARPNYAEELTERAFRAALLGFFVCSPLYPIAHCYGLFLLLYVTFSGEETRGRHATKYYVAFVLCAVSVTVGAVVAQQLSVGSWNAFVLVVLAAAVMFAFTISMSRGKK